MLQEILLLTIQFLKLADAYSDAFEFNRAIELISNHFSDEAIIDNHMVSLSLAKYNLYNFNFEKAEYYLDTALSNTENEEGLYLYADLFYRRNMIDEYITVYNNAIEKFPESYLLYSHHASYLRRKGEIAQSDSLIERSVEILNLIESPDLKQLQLLNRMLFQLGQNNDDVRKKIIKFKYRKIVNKNHLINF